MESRDQTMTDDWGQIIAPGQVFIEGRYCLHQFSGKYDSTYTQDQKKVFFFKEIIVYPFVQPVQKVKGGITISNDEKCDIIIFVRLYCTGMSSLQIKLLAFKQSILFTMFYVCVLISFFIQSFARQHVLIPYSIVCFLSSLSCYR